MYICIILSFLSNILLNDVFYESIDSLGSATLNRWMIWASVDELVAAKCILNVN